MSRPPIAMPSPRENGFTLIELIIAVAIVSILVAMALPTFLDSVRKSRRTDAFTEVARVQQMQERWRGNHSSYAASLTNAEGGTPPGLGLASVRTPKGYYDLSLSGVSATGYTLTATAVSGTSQAGDDQCKVLAARVTGGNLHFGGAGGSVDWAIPDPRRCWAQ